MRRFSKIGLAVVLAGSWAGVAGTPVFGQATVASQATNSPASAQSAQLPKLVDLGAKTCIPCKKMAPILEELQKELAGKLAVEFVDVSIKENLPIARKYQIKLIPTQIFLDKEGKELWRHEGFLSKEDILAKWKQLGHEFAVATQPASSAAAFERWKPAKADQRAKETICHLCDGTIDPKTMAIVKTDKGDVRLCGPHCYFIMYSCLTEDKTGFEKKLAVTDYAAGNMVPATEAAYLRGTAEKTGRPWVKAFATRDAAVKEMQASGGSMVAWNALQEDELSHRCGFCDRSCYPSDAAKVVVGGVNTWGCCSHCALGVAARTGKDIEVHERDRLTGEEIVVKTRDGAVASLEPATAVAWFGMRQKPDGSLASAGCFHQGFFTTAENLRKWAEQNPAETGKQITIQQALADKMKLSPQQIQKACKIGECAPK